MAPSLRWILPSIVVAAAALSACTASSPQPQPPSATGAPSGNDVAPPASGTASMPPPGAQPGPTASADVPPQSVITNDPPPGGTVTANASPTQGSDRMQAMMDLVKANRDGFRKCFDLWGKKNPAQSGSVAFQFFLKPDGSLDKAAQKRDEGNVFAVEIENCMVALAKTLTYPKSTVGKETIYTHRFEFKASKQ